MHKAKIILVKTYNLKKKPLVYNYPHKFIFDCLLIPKLEGAHPSGISVRLISLLYFLFTFHPPVCSRHWSCLLHKAQALCVQQLLSSLAEAFPSPHTFQWMHYVQSKDGGLLGMWAENLTKRAFWSVTALLIRAERRVSAGVMQDKFI